MEKARFLRNVGKCTQISTMSYDEGLEDAHSSEQFKSSLFLVELWGNLPRSYLSLQTNVTDCLQQHYVFPAYQNTHRIVKKLTALIIPSSDECYRLSAVTLCNSRLPEHPQNCEETYRAHNSLFRRMLPTVCSNTMEFPLTRTSPEL
jgi:hypothetical protein